MNRKQILQSDLYLLLAAAIWGFAFVAQRIGMEHIGPFLFNGIRFTLGGLVTLIILPLLPQTGGVPFQKPIPLSRQILGGCMAGAVMFVGATFQQLGIVSTTAGKAGFITGLYVVLVPIFGLFWGQRAGKYTWAGVILATVGLYFLSVTEQFTIQQGDLLVLIGAFFWSGHVLLIGWLSKHIPAIRISVVQFLTCGLLSLIAAMLNETIEANAVMSTLIPILYGGLMSVGLAFTLQTMGQRHAPAAHAAILLGLEGAFALFGGWIILGEGFSLRNLIGCVLMLIGTLVSQAELLFPDRGRTARAQIGEPGIT